jgi:hypothetical protein
MTIGCLAVRRQLGPFVDGELRGAADASSFAQHLDRCGEVRRRKVLEMGDGWAEALAERLARGRGRRRILAAWREPCVSLSRRRVGRVTGRAPL